MNYSVSTLTTRPDCQALLNIVNAEKSDLAYRRTGLERQHYSSAVTAVSIEADLAATTAELNALQTVLAGIPPGPTYEQTQVKFRKAEYRKFLLEQRKGNFGPIAMVEKQFDIACIDHALVEADAFIASLTTRMNELPV
jgi:hypothetical protein